MTTSERPQLMGILNVTPDSFYDGGRHQERDRALDRAREMIQAGVDIVDVGGESTRPGADPVPLDEEKNRVLPVVEELVEETSVSVDTSKPPLARRAIELGVDYLNVVTGFENPEMVDLAAEGSVNIIIMHMQGTPSTMQNNPTYDDVVDDVKRYLAARAEKLIEAGVEEDRVLVDPGIGFGKTLDHNRRLLRNVGSIKELGFPVMIGHSRISFVGDVTGEPAEGRQPGTLATSVLLMEQDVDVLRIHDVAEHVQARSIQNWLRGEGDQR
jgi:dihydropteroate synthase